MNDVYPKDNELWKEFIQRLYSELETINSDVSSIKSWMAAKDALDKENKEMIREIRNKLDNLKTWVDKANGAGEVKDKLEISGISQKKLTWDKVLIVINFLSFVAFVLVSVLK